MKYGTMSWVTVGDLILMIRKFERPNDPNSGLYTLPGGNLKEHERGANPRGRLEAAVRETEEETGLIIKPVFKGTILFDNQGRIFPTWSNPDNFLVYFFSAFDYEGDLKEKTEEGIPMWVEKKDFPGLPKSPGDEKMYEWLSSGRRFYGVINHNNDGLDKANTFVDYI